MSMSSLKDLEESVCQFYLYWDKPYCFLIMASPLNTSLFLCLVNNLLFYSILSLILVSDYILFDEVCCYSLRKYFLNYSCHSLMAL